MKHFYTLLLLTLLTSNYLIAQCPSVADLADASIDVNITSGNNCNINMGTEDEIRGDVRIRNGATLTLTAGSTFYFRSGVFRVYEGGAFSTDQNFRIERPWGAPAPYPNVRVQGNFTQTGTHRTFRVHCSSIMTVENSGIVNIAGDFYIGDTCSPDVMVTINGMVIVGGDVNINGVGDLDGVGLIDFGGSFNNTGTLGGVFTGCAGMMMTECGDPLLPVELTHFSGQAIDGQGVTLQWGTASELNNEKFEIEKSKNETDFQVIGFVKGNGTTNTPHSYTFTDRSFFRSAHYRLRQVDYDGQSEYSSIVYIPSPYSETDPINVFPNPVTDEMRLRSSKEEGLFDATLIDISGKKYLHANAASLPSIEAEINHSLNKLNKGIYILRLNTENSVRSIQFIKE